jgi:hypothetical protein
LSKLRWRGGVTACTGFISWGIRDGSIARGHGAGLVWVDWFVANENPNDPNANAVDEWPDTSGAWCDIGAQTFLRITVGSLNAAITRPIDTHQPHLNRYDVILLNPAKHPVPKQALAQRFARWLLSPEGQAAIGAYKVDGQQLFHPSAAAPK